MSPLFRLVCDLFTVNKDAVLSNETTYVLGSIVPVPLKTVTNCPGNISSPLDKLVNVIVVLLGKDP